MICNSVVVAPPDRFPVGLVEPVELHGISARQCGTGAWNRWDRRSTRSCCQEGNLASGSTGPTDRSHQNQQNCPQYHRFHPVTRKRDGSLRKNENLSVT